MEPASPGLVSTESLRYKVVLVRSPQHGAAGCEDLQTELSHRMNIAFYYPGLNLGGQQTQTLQLLEQLSGMGHNVSWVYHYGDAFLDAARRVGVTKQVHAPTYNKGRWGITRVVNRRVFSILTVRQLSSFCRKHDIDVIVSASTRDSIYCNQLVRDLPLLHFRLMGCSMQQIEKHWLRDYRALKVDRGITAYFGWPAVLSELKGVGVSESKLVELPFAVDTKRFFPLAAEDRSAARAQLGIPRGEVVLGWIGRIAGNMQVWDTVALAHELCSRGVADIRLLIVGGGPAKGRLERLLIETGLDNRTILTDWIPYERMNDMVNAMDVVPLLETDPHGGSIVREAMACGRVALSVNGASGTQALFMKRDACVLVQPDGYLVRAADEAERLIRNAVRREQLGRKARQFALEHMQFRTQAELIESALISASA